jgi:16S rRNA G966 N2-methylase RsmD
MLGIAIAVTFPERGDLIRMLHERVPGWRTYLEEGIEGVVLTRSQGERLRNFINGSEHGGRPSPFAYFETITTLSFLENPENVLVIGLGTGSNLEAVLKDPKAKSITLVEINGTAIRNLRKVEVLQGLLEDPRLTVIQDDARRWLRTTDQRFDAIFMDPLRTTSGFSNNLYSQEFFALLRDHLTPNGAVMVWSDEFEVVPRTLATVFPRVEQHCLFMVALSSPDQPSPRPERFGAILGGFDGNMAAEIRRIDCARRFDERQILAQTRGVPINTDYRPVTEYYLGSAVRRLFSRAADAP